ncbi:MAG TPA: aspartate kinase [Acidobacteria bacterium]|nr:aspartate kinase [Acidobacteriota bacterium]
MYGDLSHVVLKFGGTSVADARRLRAAAAVTAGTACRPPVAVVVSAMAGVTDTLVRLADRAGRAGRGGEWRAEVEALERRHRTTLAALGGGSRLTPPALERRLGELRLLLGVAAASGGCDPPLRARILASGERLSAVLMAAALHGIGRRAAVIDGSELVVTGAEYLEARVDLAATAVRVRRRLGRLEPGTIPVITGFLGGGPDGRTTLLGRGGSDLSAALIARGTGAGRLEIWTDVPGVLSAPPRWVPGAATVPRLSRGEAAALARWGGTVLHPRTLAPLAGTATTVVVADSLDPQAGRTVIDTGGRSSRPVAISGRAGVAVAPAGGGGRPVLDPFDGRLRGELVERAGGSSAGLDLAAITLIGDGWEVALGERIRALRLPVLGVVPGLEPDAVGLIVRTHLLRRTVKALHDHVLGAEGSRAAGARGERSLREAS